MIGVYESNCRIKLVAFRLFVSSPKSKTYPSMLGPKKISIKTKSYLVLFILAIASCAFSTVSTTQPNFSKNLLLSCRYTMSSSTTKMRGVLFQ